MEKEKKSSKKFIIFLILFLIILSAASIKIFFFREKRELSFNEIQKNIVLNDNGLEYAFSTSAGILEDFLKEKEITLGEHDEISPDTSSSIFPGINIEIRRAQKIKIEVDGKAIKNWTLQKNIGSVLHENEIALGRLDKVEPDIISPPREKEKIIITRINVEEKIIPEDIDFKTTTKNDSKLGWREKKIEQKGEKGIREVKYKITYKNGKEVSRVALEKNITKEPVTEIAVQGTYVKLGKSHTGQGTWYAFKGGLFAASPWLPMGSYARVINQDNGKSVIVQINDRGPFGPGRIIDLDKVAFQKIASIGAGVINVKVEEVLN